MLVFYRYFEKKSFICEKFFFSYEKKPSHNEKKSSINEKTATTDHCAMNPLIMNNIAALTHALTVIEGLPEGVFADQSEASFSASVGEHFRHIIEHYQLFLAGLPIGLVDYDSRPRNAQLETDPANARASIQNLCQRLRDLSAADPNQPLMVRCCTALETAEEAPVPSCVSRELVFLHSHSVHHFALITLILKRHGLTVDANFGIAPATLATPTSRSPAHEGR